MKTQIARNLLVLLTISGLFIACQKEESSIDKNSSTTSDLEIKNGNGFIHGIVIELDGEEIRQDNVFVTISNTQYTGTHFLIAPGAVIDDGLLDVTLLRRLPRHRLLRLFPTIYHGGHVEQPEVTVHKASEITIRSPNDMLMGPDGEFRGRTPARGVRTV